MRMRFTRDPREGFNRFKLVEVNMYTFYDHVISLKFAS